MKNSPSKEQYYNLQDNEYLYDPMEEEQADIDFYWQDLHMRYECYEELIDDYAHD